MKTGILLRQFMHASEGQAVRLGGTSREVGSGIGKSSRYVPSEMVGRHWLWTGASGCKAGRIMFGKRATFYSAMDTKSLGCKRPVQT